MIEVILSPGMVVSKADGSVIDVGDNNWRVSNFLDDIVARDDALIDAWWDGGSLVVHTLGMLGERKQVLFTL